VARRSALKKANKKRAARKAAKEARQRAMEERWERLSADQRSLLKGVKGVDPEA
jgi:hypothetical protein